MSNSLPCNNKYTSFSLLLGIQVETNRDNGTTFPQGARRPKVQTESTVGTRLSVPDINVTRESSASARSSANKPYYRLPETLKKNHG